MIAVRPVDVLCGVACLGLDVLFCLCVRNIGHRHFKFPVLLRVQNTFQLAESNFLAVGINIWQCSAPNMK
jgi:hypothetical protein